MNLRISLLFFLMMTIDTAGQAQQFVKNWELQTSGRTVAEATVVSNGLYAGNEEGDFYAIDKKRGSELWPFETNAKIQSRALVFSDTIFFESGNDFYLVNGVTAQLIWKYSLKSKPESLSKNGTEVLYKMDPFDDNLIHLVIPGGSFTSLVSDADGTIFLGAARVRFIP